MDMNVERTAQDSPVAVLTRDTRENIGPPIRAGSAEDATDSLGREVRIRKAVCWITAASCSVCRCMATAGHEAEKVGGLGLVKGTKLSTSAKTQLEFGGNEGAIKSSSHEDIWFEVICNLSSTTDNRMNPKREEESEIFFFLLPFFYYWQRVRLGSE